MKNKSKKFGLNEIILGTVLIIVIAVMGLGLWWFFKELSVVKRNQLQSQDMIENLQNDIQKVDGDVALMEQNHTRFQDMIEDVQENTQEIINKIAIIGDDQFELRRLIDQIDLKVGKREQSSVRKTGNERILIDVDDPNGEIGWKDEYVIELRGISDISKKFGVDWYRPYKVDKISAVKPVFVNTLPKFRHEMQRYFILRLGNGRDNQVAGAMDFRKPERKHFPFDLYLDRNRDGNLSEDIAVDRWHVKGIQIPYDDGTTEDYSLGFYAYSDEPIGVMYKSCTGRYGILEADRKRIQVLVIDNSANGIFNDDDDVILLDWDLDGKIGGSHQADDDRPLYSVLELPGASYRVAKLDAQGRRLVLRREEAK